MKGRGRGKKARKDTSSLGGPTVSRRKEYQVLIGNIKTGGSFCREARMTRKAYLVLGRWIHPPVDLGMYPSARVANLQLLRAHSGKPMKVALYHSYLQVRG